MYQKKLKSLDEGFSLGYSFPGKVVKGLKVFLLFGLAVLKSKSNSLFLGFFYYATYYSCYLLRFGTDPSSSAKLIGFDLKLVMLPAHLN